MRWTTHGVRHGNGLDFLQLIIVVRYPGRVWAKLVRAIIWHLLSLGELDDIPLQRNNVHARSAEL